MEMIVVTYITAARSTLSYHELEIHCYRSSEVPMSTKTTRTTPASAFVLSFLFLLVTAAAAQQPGGPYSAIPADAAKQANPVKPTAESIERAKKWWKLDCAMCHGDNGDGKGSLATDMKLQISDFTDPATLKGHTDGEIFYVIKKGHQDMPPEGDRVKVEENWDLVNYVRSLSKGKTEAAK
jgi:mono/diheme cytochrome c family protein